MLLTNFIRLSCITNPDLLCLFKENSVLVEKWRSPPPSITSTLICLFVAYASSLNRTLLLLFYYIFWHCLPLELSPYNMYQFLPSMFVIFFLLAYGFTLYVLRFFQLSSIKLLAIVNFYSSVDDVFPTFRTANCGWEFSIGLLTFFAFSVYPVWSDGFDVFPGYGSCVFVGNDQMWVTKQ